MSDEPVLLSSDRNCVRTLTLNRPHRKNAINRDLWIALADALVSDAKIDTFVNDLADRLAAGPVIALAQSKALLNEGADRTLRDALANEARAQAVNFATVDAREAFAAFAKRREPSFTGRWAASRSEQTNA